VLPRVEKSAAPDEEKVTVDADETEIDAKASIIRARGNVVIRRGTIVLRAERAEYNATTKVVSVEGNVHLVYEDGEWRGPRLTYDFASDSASFEEYRGFHVPWFAGGRKAEKVGRRLIVTDGFITTCEYDEPHFRLTAGRVEITRERLRARGVALRVGKVPIFWFPYFSTAFADKVVFMEIVPGRSSRWGYYVLGAHTLRINPSVEATVHADYRSRRGPGGGVDLAYRVAKTGAGTLKAYYADDERPKDADDAGDVIGHTRYRLQLHHRQELGGDIVAMTRLNALSDPDVLEDFFEREFQLEAQPDSFTEITRTAPTHTLSLFTRHQLNDFFETTERVPELRFDAVRQRLFDGPVYYEGETSLAFLQRSFAENTGLGEYDSARVDSFHQLLYPRVFGGWLSVVPRVGGRATYYDNSPTSGGPAIVRGVFNTGVELATKAACKYDVSNDAWDIHGLRHIIEPSLLYAYVPTPNRRPQELLQFDTLRPTTRLLPIEFPQYRDVDFIDLTNTLRPGLRNRLQTKRNGGEIWDLAEWSIYADFRIDKPEGVTRISDVFNEMRLRPTRWSYASLFSRVDPNDGVLRELNTDVGLLGGADWSAALETRFLQADSSLLALRLYAKLTDNWAVRIYQRFEARESRWEEQDYALERDLHCWTAALSFRYRDQRVGPDDFRVFIALTLKALPEYRISTGL
jgi:LPS-assembly protein